ncbi:hypothetical protein LCGC14_0417930 [marine sediment metagenome]|uniref:HNH domain-containing protein n=1 Tax=marine sediment metagenome TaxID=412755 RepID=A0A0F9T9U5_9ZZZZ
MRIKVDKADQMFSWYVRKRDDHCMRCLSPVGYNLKGQPNTHENSHYFGRRKENTRYDPENCDTLCTACHVTWGSEDREDYRDFKIKQLGEEGFKNLMIRSYLTKKKDRAASYIYAKTLYDSIPSLE